LCVKNIDIDVDVHEIEVAPFQVIKERRRFAS